MSSSIKDENICDCKESVSSNSGGSEDNGHENSEEQDSEKETHESKSEASEDSDTKSQKSEFFQTGTMDYTDSSAPSGKTFKTKYVDNAAKRSPGNDCQESEITKDPDFSPPNGNLFPAELVADLKMKSSNSETHKNAIYKDSSTEYNSIGCKPLEDLNNASSEVSKYLPKSQSQGNLDNNSLSGDGSPVAGPSREPKLICHDADNSPLTQEIYGPQTNLTDFADVSEVTSDGMEATLRVQRKTKKKTKAANKSETESVEEGLVGNPNLFFPIWNEDSAKEAESTTTDDVRVTPFEDIGLEQNQNIPSPPPSENLASSVEVQDSANPETPDDGSKSNKSDNSDEQSSEKESDNPETPDKQSSANKSDNPEMPDQKSSVNESDKPETPDNESTTNESDNLELPDESPSNKSFDNLELPDESPSNKSFDNPETPEDEFAMDIVSDNIEIFGDESVAIKSDSLETSESEGNKPCDPECDLEFFLDHSKDKPSNSQKRKLSIIHEEPEEFGQVAKRLRPSESIEETGADMIS